MPTRALYELALKILGSENFEGRLSWSPICKAQGPDGAIYIPTRALYELGQKIFSDLKILKGNFLGYRSTGFKAHAHRIEAHDCTSAARVAKELTGATPPPLVPRAPRWVPFYSQRILFMGRWLHPRIIFSWA